MVSCRHSLGNQRSLSPSHHCVLRVHVNVSMPAQGTVLLRELALCPNNGIHRCNTSVIALHKIGILKHRKSLLCLNLIPPLRSRIQSPLTQLPLRQLLQPALGTHNFTDLEIVLTRLPTKHKRPTLNGIMDLFLRHPRLQLPPHLLLRLGQLLLAARLPVLSVLVVALHLFGVDGHVRLPRAAQVRRQVRVEAARDESARCVAAREERVRAPWSVDLAAGADVVDCAVQRDVDWFRRVGAVVLQEFEVVEADGTRLVLLVDRVTGGRSAAYEELLQLAWLRPPRSVAPAHAVAGHEVAGCGAEKEESAENTQDVCRFEARIGLWCCCGTLGGCLVAVRAIGHVSFSNV